MKIALFDAHGEDHVGILTDAGMFDFSRALQAYRLIQKGQVTPPATDMVTLMRQDVFNRETFETVLSFAAKHNLQDAFTVAGETKLRAPIRRPGKIIALGGNYHFEGEPDPAEPPFFFKVSSSVIGPEEPIVYRRIFKQVDPEVELAVIIGKEARAIGRSQAADVIAGYSIINDVTERQLQNAAWGKRPWEYTKSIDTFTPFGPYLVTPDEVASPSQPTMGIKVNGKDVLETAVHKMLFDIPFLIEYFSAYMTLEPGDVIATGTPGHPENLQPGDVVELVVAGVGTLRNHVVAEG